MSTSRELLESLPRLDDLCRTPISPEALAEWARMGLFYCTDLTVGENTIEAPSERRVVVAKYLATTFDHLASGETGLPVAGGVFMANNPGGYYRGPLGEGRPGIASVLLASDRKGAKLWLGEPDGSGGGPTAMAGVLSLGEKEASRLREKITMNPDGLLHVHYDQFSSGGLLSVGVTRHEKSTLQYMLDIYELSLLRSGVNDESLRRLGGLGMFFIYADTDARSSAEGVAMRVGVVIPDDEAGTKVRSLPARLAGEVVIRKGRIVRLDGNLSIMIGSVELKVRDAQSRFLASYTGEIASVETGALIMPPGNAKKVRPTIQRKGRLDVVHMTPGVDGYYLPVVDTLQQSKVEETRTRAWGFFARISG